MTTEAWEIVWMPTFGSDGLSKLIVRHPADLERLIAAALAKRDAEIERLKAKDDTLDRYEARVETLAAALTGAARLWDDAYLGPDGLGSSLVPTVREVKWREEARAALAAGKVEL